MSYLVTALVSCYNSSMFLPGCLEDLLQQTLYQKGQLEIIVIDSGSLESEGAIVAGYQKHYQHIKYLKTERETVYGAWNRGIEIALGKFVTNANTDDAHRKDALELLATALNSYPEADLAYSHCAFTNRPNDTFPSSNSYLDCLLPSFTPALGMFYCLLGPHPLWRKSVFSKIGAFDSAFSCAGDYDFQMRFIQASLQAVLVPEILSLFYQNPNGLSLSSDKTIIESKKIEFKYRRSIPATCLYSVNEADFLSIADAWVAQGNLALTWECAWEKNPPKDYHYAFECYTKALEVMPGYYPAVKNIVSCLALEGKWKACEYFATKYQQDIEPYEVSVRSNNQPLIAASVSPRVCTQTYIPFSLLPNSCIFEQLQNPLGFSEIRNNLGRVFAFVENAIAAINAGDMGTAFKDLQDAVAHAEGDADTLIGIGVLLLGLGRYDVAKELLAAVTVTVAESSELAQYQYFATSGSTGANPQLPQAWLDTAMRSLANLEFKALNLPVKMAPHLLAGVKAAEQGNLVAVLTDYRNALSDVDTTSLFTRTLRDKVAFLESSLGLAAVKPLPPISLVTANRAGDHRLSRLCRQDDFETDWYRQMCRELGIPAGHYERKNWEYYFVARGLQEERLLEAGRMGLGFGVGKEKLISYFAKRGCAVLATDLEPDNAAKKAWVDTNQHSDSVRDLFLPGICDYETFQSRVQFAYVDMNRIPEGLQQGEFDFTWSCCAFEHVGSIEQGKQFILNQMKCLKPGGVALHTTEFNLSSDELTVSSGPTVIFRKRDIEELAEALRKEGHEITVSYDVGTGELDRYVDIPPYLTAPDKRHLRLLLWKYVTTSIGLFIRKKI